MSYRCFPLDYVMSRMSIALKMLSIVDRRADLRLHPPYLLAAGSPGAPV